MDFLADLDSLPSHHEKPHNIFTEDLGLIDVSQINFSDDENWLVETPNNSSDVRQRLYALYTREEEPQASPKIFDSRTFTRRRIIRPSILDVTDGDPVIEETPPIPIKPLHFDLTQPAASVYFDNILANATSTVDSFVNMSPPSLVNSMCSSTFTNLMENSVIKNDPVLREISDMDFTRSVLQQENEPMSQSESCSSLNSDVIETLLKNGTEDDRELAKVVDEASDTFIMEAERTVIISDDFCNRTFQRNKLASDSTFSTQKNRTLNLPQRQDATITIEKNYVRKSEDKPLENVKRLLDRRPSPSMDLNRLSYIVDHNETYVALNQSKRNSFGSSDSMDNGDYMSLSSGSSKSSHRGSINIQEKYLQHIMSTPKPVNKEDLSWPPADLSPISGRNSDPELSSIEKSKPGLTIPCNTIRKQKSVGQLNRQIPDFRKQNNIKGSSPDLKSGLRKPTNLNSMGHTLKGSYTSLKPLNPNLPVAPPPLQIVKREAPKTDDAQFVKPKSDRPSALPRPVSRIPGPRSIRPTSKSAGHQGRH